MANYSFIVSYDGSRYEGWQRQTRTEETIQGKLEKALRKLTGEEAQVIGAGRTDAGVHARGQCANVQLSVALPVRQLEDELNRLLPDDIGVSRMRIAGGVFTVVSPRQENSIATAFAPAVKRTYSRGAMCGSWEKRSIFPPWKRPRIFWRAGTTSSPSVEIGT